MSKPLRQAALALALAASTAAHAGFATIDFSSQFNAGFANGSLLNGDTYPTGSQSFAGVPFQIAPSRALSGAPQNNIWWGVGPTNPAVLSITGLNIANATSGYTLMGTLWGNNGGPNQLTYASIAFHFSDNSTTLFNLLGGRDIRDYNFNPAYTTSLGANTIEVFNNAGPVGTPAGQHYDRQAFAFGANAGKTLTGITLTDTGADNFQRVFLSAATIETADVRAIPVPAAAWLLLSGLGVMGAFQRKRALA